MPKTRKTVKRAKHPKKEKQNAKYLARDPYVLDDGVTQSLMGNFLTCRKRTRMYLDGWRPVQTKQSLVYGSLFHDLLEKLYNQIRLGGVSPDDAEEFFEDFIGPWIKKQIKRGTFDTVSTAHFLAAQAKAVFTPYCEYWAEDFKPDLWLELEGKFDTKVQLGAYQYRLRGRRDGLQIRSPARLRMIEHKTKSQIPERLDDVLLFDFQNLFYLLTLNVDLKALYAGKYKPVVDVLYNIIRRPGIKIKVGETLNRYTDRVRADITKDEKRLTHYFKRNELIYPLDTQEKFAEDLRHQLTEFKLWLQGTLHTFRGPSSMCMPGWVCQFIDACAYNTMDGYQQTGLLFEELID